MKKIYVLMLCVAVCLMSAGCVGPAKVPPIVTIETNETAFLVPLEGATKENQAQFMSLDYLEKAKLATKRITIPIRQRRIGRGYWNYEWIPTMRVIKVDRTPVTREWTQDKETGTSKTNEAILVESKDSIGFAVGVNITCLITEEDASRFLYNYSGKDLSYIIDHNVRGKVTSVLSREFGSRELQQCKSDKKEISDVLLKETRDAFSDMGITVTNLGLVGGLEYENPEIQSAINAAYVAEMNIKQQEMAKQAQIQINEKELSIAVNKRKVAEEWNLAKDAQIARTNLEIRRTIAEKWDGSFPRNIVPANSSMLFNLDTREQ